MLPEKATEQLKGSMYESNAKVDSWWKLISSVLYVLLVIGGSVALSCSLYFFALWLVAR